MPTNTIERGGKFKAMVFCWVLGLGGFFAWSSLAAIGDYYYKVFPHYHPSRVFPLVYQPCSFITMLVFAHKPSNVDRRKRNIVGYSIFTASTFFLIILDLATGGKGGVGPYAGICVLVACSGVADAHVQGGMMGELSFMCPQFMQSFFAGLATAGALTSALRLIIKATFKKTTGGLRKGAILFLAISTFFEFVCVIVYTTWFAKLPIVKYYRSKAAMEGARIAATDLAVVEIQRQDDGSQEDQQSNKQLLLQNIDYALDLYLTFASSMLIFPGFLYENTGGHHKLGSWYPLILILVYNSWNLVARYIPLISYLKLESRKGLMVLNLSRFLLIPAFYFTGKYGGQGWMIFLTSFFGLTNGYLSVCVMIVAPKGYQGRDQCALGSLLALSISAGIFSGVALGWLWIIGQDNF